MGAGVDSGAAGAGPIRTVFFGTPAFAVPTLEALARAPSFDLQLAVTQPDRPAGRGRRLEAPPVKRAAEALGVPVYQPASLRAEDARAPLSAVAADVFVVAAYGLVFGAKTLALPRFGCVNVHASLLPAYRGAAPIAAAIAMGERRTGVSLMAMRRGLDTGPVIAVADLEVAPDDTHETLTGRLASLGAALTVAELPAFAAGERPPVSQCGGATLTRPLLKADGWLEWTRPALELERRVRAMWPWPRAWTTIGAGDDDPGPVQVHRATLVADTAEGSEAPGTVLRSRGDAILVSTGGGALALDTVQTAGGRPVPGAALLSGRRLRIGDRLGTAGAPTPPPPLVVPDSTPGDS